ncbi:MAG: hypothetical protein IH586_04700 [Anaerolineaceae bacterium]|nr:hypothetical protein [Anaerolineaceae bacterium]
MDHLSPLGWAAIGLICLIIIVMNVGLITLVRYKPKLNMKPPPAQNGERMNRLVGVLKDPFGEERKQLKALSDLVEQLHEEKKIDPGKE